MVLDVAYFFKKETFCFAYDTTRNFGVYGKFRMFLFGCFFCSNFLLCSRMRSCSTTSLSHSLTHLESRDIETFRLVSSLSPRESNIVAWFASPFVFGVKTYRFGVCGGMMDCSRRENNNKLAARKQHNKCDRDLLRPAVQ